jgi:molybdopterin-binding protein
MKLSARNILKGTVKDIKTGTVNTEIIVQLAGGEELVSMITKESAEKTRIETGKGRLRGDQGFQCNDRNGLKN